MTAAGISNAMESSNEAKKSEFVQVLCCMCGMLIDPNPSNTCATCLASQADITRGISTEVTLFQCRGCQRWHKEAGKWVACPLESRELMALCLSHVGGLSRKGRNQRLVDASWIWTEPHSMRLKTRLTIQRQMDGGATSANTSSTILQQSFVVVYTVRNQQCVECQAEFRQGAWKSLIQVRQRVGHKRTFLYLEQLILKHSAHRGALSIETFADGMDFYFPDKSKATRFLCFLESVVPTRVKSSKKLISTDDKSNISNFKYTNLVEICPLCKDDLLYLPIPVARSLGNIARLVLVQQVTSWIHLIDPLTGQTASLEPNVYWRHPFVPLVTAARCRLTRYMVLSKEPVAPLRPNLSKKRPTRKQQSKLASVTFTPENDVGTGLEKEETSHIGYLLRSGDVCLGYNLVETQFSQQHEEAENMRTAGKLADVVLVRKLYGANQHHEHDVTTETTADATPKRQQRFWKLQRLPVTEGDTTVKSRRKRNNNEDAMDEDEEDFLQEVEADKEMRKNINLYKDETYQGNTKDAMDEDDNEDDQEIKLDELLGGLDLEIKNDSDDEDKKRPSDGISDQEAWDLAARIQTEPGEKAAQDGITYVNQHDARQVKDKDVAIHVKMNDKDEKEVFGKQFMNEKFKFT